jgi:aldehyde dehydrogenase (NAD+)
MEPMLRMRYPPYTPDKVEYFAVPLRQKIPESSVPVIDGDNWVREKDT